MNRFLLAVLMTANLAAPAHAEKHNIMHYWDIAFGKSDYQGFKDFQFTTKDVANGYLNFTAGFAGLIEMALWREASGNDLVGIAEVHCDLDTTSLCSQSIAFYHFEGGRKIGVTEQVLPLNEVEAHYKEMAKEWKGKQTPNTIFDETLWYVIPQKGTAITVALFINQNQPEGEAKITIGELAWDKTKFVFRKKRPVF